jgi:glyoxylase-like metal-dependent hydrolase (beta-lactamase superfamily II)
MRERLFQAGGFKLITGVDTVLITHLHYDHTIDVADLWQFTRTSFRPTRAAKT